MPEDNAPTSTPALPEATLADFLESHPPGQPVHITDLTTKVWQNGFHAYFLTQPELQLHCTHERCNGIRVFRAIASPGAKISDDALVNVFVRYRCSNCQHEDKTFALAVGRDPAKETGVCFKFGELPSFGPPTPSRLIKLIGPDRDIFLRGRRSENQGLGIGAFVYYRRVVENQKNRILEEIKRVLEKIGGKQDAIHIFDAAISETQFSKAIEMAKTALPESLLINGHNPLVLLHSALSEGVHELSDEECLDLASSIRIVLSELSDRLASALKDEAELSKALGKLMGKTTKG